MPNSSHPIHPHLRNGDSPNPNRGAGPTKATEYSESFVPFKMAQETFYLLPLKDDGSPDVPGGYIYLPPPDSLKYSLRFLIEGSSSICRDGTLWVNIPESGQSFDRQAFRAFK